MTILTVSALKHELKTELLRIHRMVTAHSCFIVTRYQTRDDQRYPSLEEHMGEGRRFYVRAL